MMDTTLGWIGFEQAATIREEGSEKFADLATMKEKDIRDLAESYSIGALLPMGGPFSGYSIHDRSHLLGPGLRADWRGTFTSNCRCRALSGRVG